MFELAMRRPRGVLAVTLISACTVLILLGQSFLQPTGAGAAPLEQAKPTTHPVEGRENCLMCHQPGAGAKPSPADHAGRATETCLMCHSAQTAAAPAAPAVAPATKPPAATPVTQQPSATAVPTKPQPTAEPTKAEAAATASSGQPSPTTHQVYGRENCLTCHQTGTGIKPSPADHAGRAKESCLACHKPTASALATPTVAAKAQPLVDVAEASEVCRKCHDKPEFETVSGATARPDIVKQLESDRAYAHRFVACVTCHITDPHKTLEPVTKESIADACGRCHVAQREEHVISVHGQSLAHGGKDAATCIDCHSAQNTPHSITRVLSPDSPAYRASVASTCAKCHAKTDLMERYGVPTEVYATYMTTFHGKANVLSPYEITQHPKATCVNCHGYHDIKADDDPTSPVNHDNLPSTCGGCHPGAGEQFASGWLGHKEATPQQFPIVYFAERFFFFFTSSVLTFGFIFMVALELGSWILRRRPTQH